MTRPASVGNEPASPSLKRSALSSKSRWQANPRYLYYRSYATQHRPPTAASIRANAALAALAFLAAGAVYYRSSKDAAPSSSDIGYVPGESFSFSLRSSRGGKDHTFQYKTPEEIERRLRENESGADVRQAGLPVVRWDRNWVASNEPCEDRSAVDLPTEAAATQEPAGRAASASVARNPMLVSVFDGHAGFATSQYLSEQLHSFMQQGLRSDNGTSRSWTERLLSSFGEWFSSAPALAEEEATKENLKKLFLQFDSESIVYAPFKRHQEYLAARNRAGRLHDHPKTPEDEELYSKFLSAVHVANSGAVLVTAVVDPVQDDLFVVNTGDCRAVAGWETKDGKWRCDVLTEDQMGDNPKEVARAEHPGEEETVIMRGRVLGGLQPTRAMADSSYKWTAQLNDYLTGLVTPEGIRMRSKRPYYLTPPYVTAEPEVTHRKIHGNPDEKLRFIIMATDGLWDEITSEEATLLVASYLRQTKRSDIPKSHLPEAFPLVAVPEQERKFPIQDLPGQGSRREGSWVYEGDANAATHLIRNSLGGGDRKARAQLLSMYGPVTRYKRDDVTVTVLFFGDDESHAQTGRATAGSS